jgi:crossover junction endodeoxyribonuclease RuvC
MIGSVRQRIVLGIDPGLSTSGFSIATIITNKIELKECGYLSFKTGDEISAKIKKFYDFFTEKIIEHTITEIALETPFFSKNSMTFLKLGYVRSVVYLLKEQHSLSLHEFAPRSIKQAITGFGGAEKEQVQKTLFTLFPALGKIGTMKYDVTDAVAASVCALWKQQ